MFHSNAFNREEMVNGLDKSIGLCLVGYGFIFVFDIGWGNAFIDLAIIIALLRLGLSPQGLKVDLKVLGLMIAYFFSLIITAFVANQAPSSAFQAISRLIYSMVPPFLLGSLFIKNRLQRTWLLYSMVLAGIVASGYSFWQAIHSSSRATGFIDLLELAGELSIIIPILLVVVMYREQGRYIRLFLWGALLLMTGALVLNGTRGAWVAIAIVSIVCLFSYSIKPAVSKRKVAVLIASILLVLIVVVSVSPMARSRLVTATITGSTAAARIAMWPSAWNMFVDNPLFGIGLGNYHDQYIMLYARTDLIEKHYGRLYDKWSTHTHPHNSLLHLLAEAGLIGFACFLFLYSFVLYRFFSRLQHNKNENLWDRVALLELGVFLLFALTENVLFGMNQYTQSLWLAIGVAWNAET